MHKSIKLWSFADVDRSGKVRWTAREPGYEIEEIKVGLGEHTSDPYRQLNPYEQIPTADRALRRLSVRYPPLMMK